MFKIGDIIEYGTARDSVQARIYAVFGDKIAIDHRTFERGRTIRANSSKILGLVS